ncbi:MAG TPA: putative quinol monooxygenase [Burkholderiaceae bacterium]|nr:putative quinol monooxygenase [Burkholderiaceae bacterium]
MVIVLASVMLKPGRLDEALALSLQHVARSRAEAGCLAHAVHRDSEDAQRIVFVERWIDRAALAAHFQVPASRAFVKALAGLASAPPQMTLYEASEITL